MMDYTCRYGVRIYFARGFYHVRGHRSRPSPPWESLPQDPQLSLDRRFNRHGILVPAFRPHASTSFIVGAATKEADICRDLDQRYQSSTAIPFGYPIQA